MRVLSDIFGTQGDEDLIGSARWERLYGLGGRDRLYAKAGDDELWGGAGNDLLDGGEGQDAMYGGSGDDSYRVDNAGDTASEETVPGQDDGGADVVVSTISFNLGTFVERLELSGVAAIDGAGNDLANNIKGNGASNVLAGGAGQDTIYGYAGDDVLIGGAGRDFLYGGEGADTFVLRREDGFWDKIYDFTAQDRLGVYGSEFGLSEGAGFIGGVLDPAYFVAGNAATAVGHGQFVYIASKFEILWDADGAGTGKAVRIALVEPGNVVTSDQFRAFGQDIRASVVAVAPTPREEGGSPIWFALKLSEPARDDVILTCSTVNGSAIGGQDFVSLASAEVIVRAGSTTAYVPVTVLDDAFAEGVESFSLRIDAARDATTGSAIAVNVAAASASIRDEGAGVVAERSTKALGITDPSAIGYDAVTDTLFVADSEVDEEPFFRTNNFWALDRAGNLKSSMQLPYTKEPTGLAMDAASGRIFVTDDDKYKVFVVDRNAPGTMLREFDTRPLGAIDPEDIAIDSDTGNLFICNGLDRRIVEVNQQGTQVFSSVVLPGEIVDPEAMCFDTRENLFYVGGGFSDKIWKVDRSGAIVDVLTVLEEARQPGTNARVKVKDMDFAPASDGSGVTHLYVTDYGNSHVDDGRVIELTLGDGWLIS